MNVFSIRTLKLEDMEEKRKKLTHRWFNDLLFFVKNAPPCPYLYKVYSLATMLN